MTYYGMLDEMLRTMNQDMHGKYTDHSFIKSIESDELRTALLLKLLQDRYVTVQDSTVLKHYTISLDGILFIGDGGYMRAYRRQRWGDAWTVMRTVGTIAYSLAVLAVAIWAVTVELRN